MELSVDSNRSPKPLEMVLFSRLGVHSPLLPHLYNRVQVRENIPKSNIVFPKIVLFLKHLFMRTLLLLLIFQCLLVLASSETEVDFDDLDDEDEEESDINELDAFIKRFGNSYGYNNTINIIREQELKRTNNAVYLDYAGAGIYRESQVRKCSEILLDGFFGNAHSRSPSSLNTERLVFIWTLVSL